MKNFAKTSLLIIDDDLLYADSVRDYLSEQNIEVTLAHTISAARTLHENTGYDVVLLDNNLPDGSGLELVPEILRVNDRAKIILVTAFPSFDNAVQALKNGAYDYISKPIDLDELQATVERAVRTSNLEAVEQVERYRKDKEKQSIALIGDGTALRENRELILKAARTNASVLITGETGTGKNVVAKAIHFAGSNDNAPYISVNCAAIPETLIESELFGVEKGAFTGAIATRKGTFELADGGTLLLDEIGEMPFSLQAKLLSALEDRVIRRVGSTTERAVNVRVIAATNAAPESAIQNGLFRRDLFYRLSVIRIHLAPLRERKSDIPFLADHFIEHFAPGRGIEIPGEEIERLQNYNFPGNVRELRNIIERCLILQEGKFIYPSKLIDFADANNLTQESNFQTVNITGNDKVMTLGEVEKLYILDILEKNEKNLTRSAAALDISLSTLKRKLREYGLR
jgi:DNA-binding NtrC family response regulator